MKKLHINIIQAHTTHDHDMAKAGLDPIGKGIEAVRSKGFDWTEHAVAVHEMVKE